MSTIVKKLSSRKLWLATASFVSMLSVFVFKADTTTAENLATLVMAGGSVIAYIVAEGWSDAAAADTTQNYTVTGDAHIHMGEGTATDE